MLSCFLSANARKKILFDAANGMKQHSLKKVGIDGRLPNYRCQNSGDIEMAELTVSSDNATILVRKKWCQQLPFLQIAPNSAFFSGSEPLESRDCSGNVVA
ncbi:hypothetical protein ACFS07_35520 [Undibacterium arcticum]